MSLCRRMSPPSQRAHKSCYCFTSVWPPGCQPHSPSRASSSPPPEWLSPTTGLTTSPILSPRSWQLLTWHSRHPLLPSPNLTPVYLNSFIFLCALPNLMIQKYEICSSLTILLFCFSLCCSLCLECPFP